MGTMYKWPTKAFARGAVSDDKLAELVAALPDYSRTETLAEYSGKVDTAVMHTFAEFFLAVLGNYPDAELTRDFKVVRPLTRDELENVALAGLQSDMYYHPEKYPAITTSEYKED